LFGSITCIFELVSAFLGLSLITYHGVVSRSAHNPVMKVRVCQWPAGAESTQRASPRASPWRRTMFVVILISGDVFALLFTTVLL
jgi:hypothetical protein